MKTLITFFALLLIGASTVSTQQRRTMRWVDQNGGLDPNGYQKSTTIQEAIEGATDGDTVRILPGRYPENIRCGKAIVIQGGGIFNTFITSDLSSTPAVVMTKGKIMWVSISSSTSSGLDIQNATAVNCSFQTSKEHGVYCKGQNAVVTNCISINNGVEGYFCASGGTLTVINSISYKNNDGGYYESNGGNMTAKYCLSFGNKNYEISSGVTNINSKSEDPSFSPDGSFRTSKSNNGDNALSDRDGKISTIGYYGGPDAPLIPYVELPSIKLNTDGTIQFDMVGKVGY